ncbi:MAG: ABC transporter substrate-binding protein [Pseudobutyrivibrio sp.]|nr:ABC transporter substrate-binding protein [Pseudobutyrivibrio sp.]
MKKRMKKLGALTLAAVSAVSMVACGSGNNATGANPEAGANGASGNSAYDTLVVGTQSMEGVFNPYFYSSAYDNQVLDAVFSSICSLDPDGVLVDESGHVEVEEKDGKYIYTVSLQEGLVFSDGEPVTIDDVISFYYVCADPTYDGMSTIGTLDIEGMADYKKSAAVLWKALATAGKDNTDFTSWDEATQTKFWEEDLPSAGEKFAQEIVDYCVANGYCDDATNVAAAAPNWGFEVAEGATALDFWNVMVDAYDGDILTLSATETAGSSIGDLLDASYAEVIELAAVDTITGIQKIDDLTCTVTFNSPNISADKQIAWIPIMPSHYYTFTKGDLSGCRDKNNAPLGSGEYIFESYDNNIVTLRANENYFRGCPKIPNLKIQAVDEEVKVDLVLNSEIDITDPSASLEIIDQLNQNSDIASYSLVDNPGYGYIGINAERVSDINVRKGLMCLMNREPAVKSYYGDLGVVIERPMTPTLAEYPDDATAYYTYDPAKALEYFEAAGYAKDANGKLCKNGEQLKITVGIGEASSHPSTPILTQMANDMADMGAELVVNDLQFSVLSPMVKGGELDMWVMAWGNSTDCDLTQMFGSEGGTNYQRYYDPKLDAIQAEILKTVDFDARKALVAEELDMIMEAAVYMPVYQRKNMEIYNEVTFNTSTLPAETTTYFNYDDQYQVLEMR